MMNIINIHKSMNLKLFCY